MSFLKVIEMPSNNSPIAWKDNTEAAFKNAKPGEQAAFLLEQAIVLNYLTRIYGEEGLPILINDYKKYVINWFVPTVKSNFYSKEPDPIVKLSYLNIESLLGISNGKVDAAECTKVITSQLYNIPHAVDASFYAPYVLFVERTSDVTKYIESDEMDQSRSFNVSTACSIPSFSVNGRTLYANYETMFSSYQLNYKQLGKLVAQGICPCSIWSYWAGYNWRGIAFSGVMGVLAAQCLERDANAIPKGSTMFGFYEIYRKLVPGTSRVDQSNSLALLSETQHRRAVIKFLCYLRETYGVVFDDAELLSHFVATSGIDEANTLHKFFTSQDAKEVSVEMYNVFKRSCFGTFSELDFVTNGGYDRKEQSGSLINAKKTGEDETPDAQQDNDEDPKTRRKNKKNNESAQGDSSSADEGTTDEAVFAGPDATDNQDSSDATETDQAQSNQEDSTTPDSNPDEEQTNPNESSDTKNQTESDTHTTKLPSVPKLDDKRGVKLSLSEGETTSTVLYRKELEAYIDSLLSNPPSILSTQTIAAIKKMKAHWLHLLSVKDLHDWLRAMVRLPKSITIKR